jgi:hypothetical protein
MRQPCTWGDELSLRAVCDAYGVVVHVVTSDKEYWHVDYRPFVPRAPFRHIFLAYIAPVHYISVVLQEDVDRDDGERGVSAAA